MSVFYKYAYIGENIQWVDQNEFDNLDLLFPSLKNSRQCPYIYNEIDKRILLKSNSLANLAEIFEKKLWALRNKPSKDLLGWDMYVVLNKTFALKKYNRLFGVKFKVISQTEDCKVIWPTQKIEQWEKIDGILLSKVLKNKETENGI